MWLLTAEGDSLVDGMPWALAHQLLELLSCFPPWLRLSHELSVNPFICLKILLPILFSVHKESMKQSLKTTSTANRQHD